MTCCNSCIRISSSSAVLLMGSVFISTHIVPIPSLLDVNVLPLPNFLLAKIFLTSGIFAISSSRPIKTVIESRFTLKISIFIFFFFHDLKKLKENCPFILTALFRLLLCLGFDSDLNNRRVLSKYTYCYFGYNR